MLLAPSSQKYFMRGFVTKLKLRQYIFD